jgi:hypothetical protein
MPLHLEPVDLSDKLEDYKSVLIVSCPVCPPVSLATDRDSPFIEFFKHGIKTAAYEDYLHEVRDSFEQRGVSTGVFTSYLPCAATCLWTRGQRDRLLKRAKDYDVALVMGCESARHTVEETLKNTDCEVVLAMELVGITNANLKFEFPLTVKFEDTARVNANERVKTLSSASIR